MNPSIVDTTPGGAQGGMCYWSNRQGRNGRDLHTCTAIFSFVNIRVSLLLQYERERFPLIKRLINQRENENQILI